MLSKIYLPVIIQLIGSVLEQAFSFIVFST
jgi:hypothetical protein